MAYVQGLFNPTRQAKIAMDQMQATGLGNVWEAHQRDGFSMVLNPRMLMDVQ